MVRHLSKTPLLPVTQLSPWFSRAALQRRHSIAWSHPGLNRSRLTRFANPRDSAGWKRSKRAILVCRNTGAAAGDIDISIENLRGAASNDTLTGDNFNNVLEGGPDGDSLDGRGGSDPANYEHATAGVTANLANPNDPINPNTGEAFGDSYQSIENLLGSRFNDHPIGDAIANVLDGGNGTLPNSLRRWPARQYTTRST